MNEPTRGPLFACLYPGLCDKARQMGYALAIHGTLVNDLDLVAIPWVDTAASPLELKDALMSHIGACGYGDLLRRDGLPENHVQSILSREKIDPVIKPHGRLAWNLYLFAGAKVDLSIMPKTE